MSDHTFLHWQLATDEKGIVWLGLDRADARVNTLSSEVLEELQVALDDIAAGSPRALVIYSRKENGFAAGADVADFKRIQSEPEAYELVRRGQRVLDKVAALPCPTVAMIHGYALGGGLELALACRYRVLADTAEAQLGLPEVRLGIHPGFGGTVRAVATIGVLKAMNLMLTGRTVRGQEALSSGLVDRLASPTELRERATNLALKAPSEQRASFGQRLLGLSAIRPFVARILRKQVHQRVRKDHYPAPYAIVSLWERHGARARPESFEAEARSIASLLCGSTTRNLVRVFFLRERLKGLGKRDTRPPRQIHVIGAGTMGGDIAAWCALHGMSVSLEDRDAAYVERALARAERFFERRLHRRDQAEEARKRLRMDLRGDALPDADLVIEAIFEDPEAKADLLRRVEPRLGEQAILATNTSSIPLETLARSLQQPGRLVGMHFFNPVARMPLVEVVAFSRTEAATIDRALAAARALGKLPLPVRSSPGFLVNRVLAPYLAAAFAAWDQGIPLEAIDYAAEDFGMPMGPIELADTVGLDVALSVSRQLGQLLELPPPPGRLQDLVTEGHTGRKSGQGLYAWHQGRARKRTPKNSQVDENLQSRLILPLLNEAVRCLRERVVEDEDLLDAGVVFGTGFAPFRGGPLHYVRETGPQRLETLLQGLAVSLGTSYQPDSGWKFLLDKQNVEH